MPTVCDIAKNGDPSKEVILSGVIAKAYNDLLGVSFNDVNVSWVSVVGSSQDCVTSLVSNESDTTIVIVPYGEQDFDHIFPHSLDRDMSVPILSAYNATSRKAMQHVDIATSAITGLSVGVIVTSVVLFLTCHVLLNMATWIREAREEQSRTQIRRPRIRFGFEVFAHAIQQESMDFDDLTRRYICVMLTMTSFFVLYALSAVVTTELVVLPQPKLIKTFDDIISQPNLRIIDMQHDIMNNVKTQALWHQLKDRIVNGSDSQDVYSGFAKNMQGLFTAQHVFLFPDNFLKECRKMTCSFTPIMRTSYGIPAFPFIAQDPTFPIVLMTHIMSQRFRTTQEGKKVVKNVRRGMESGFYDHYSKRYKTGDNPFANLMPKVETNNMEDRCVHERVVSYDVPNTMTVEIPNLLSAFKLFALGSGIAVMVWTLQVIFYGFYPRTFTWRIGTRCRVLPASADEVIDRRIRSAPDGRVRSREGRHDRRPRTCY